MTSNKPLTGSRRAHLRRVGTYFFAIIAFLAMQAGTAFASQIFGVDAANNLVRFDSATPGTLIETKPVQGLAPGETIQGLDFRPADGTLFALGSSSRLYIIDYISNPAVATPVGNAGAFTLSGNNFGFDFNPMVDRIRVVSDTEQNIRLNPNDGSLFATDSALVYDDTTADGNPIDPNAGANPNVVGSAYTPNVASAPNSLLYGIDISLDILVLQNPPNAGVLHTVGPLGVNVLGNVGFDIDTTGGTDTAFMAANVGGTEQLYQIDLTTGAATLVGQIGAGIPLQGIAVAPSTFNATLVGNTVTFNGNAASSTIVFDQSGGLLRHNRFSAGDGGFMSDFDFDSNDPGNQILSASDPAVTIIVNAGGSDDRIAIGSASAPASGLAATFQINGQGGGDTLTIDDAASTIGRTISVNGGPSTFTGLGPPISYGTLENIFLNAGSDIDSIFIQGTSAATTNINAGGGDDNVIFFDGATLSDGFIDGGPGTNTLDYEFYTTPVIVDLSPAGAQTRFFALMTGAQQPGPLSNSPASGRLLGFLNNAQSEFAFNVTYQGLTGSPISGTHFHNQITGVSGPIVRGLFPSEQNGLVTPAGTLSGVWSNSDPTLTPPDPGAPGAPVRPLNAPSPVTPGSTLVQELIAGRIYFDIHTLPNFPSGEIRGQVLAQGTVGPATATGGVRNFDKVFGGSAADSITGNANPNVLLGGDGNDTLVGGQGGDQLFGEGGDDTIIWNNGDGSDFIDGDDGNDTVQVNGSPAGGDQFLLQVNPADSSRLRFDRTNLGLFNLNIGTVEALEFNTLGGDDTATIEFAGGNPIPVNGINYDGGAGSDRLALQRSSGNYVADAMIHTATGPGTGLATATGGGTITYTGLEPVDDTVPTINFTFTAPVASDQIQLIDGPGVLGFATAQINDGGTSQFELINFARKTNVTINSGIGDQLVVINYSTAAEGLTNLNVNTNDSDDEIDLIAVADGTTTGVNTGSSGDYVRVVGAGIPSNATLHLDGSNGFDHLVYENGGAPVSSSPGPGPGQTTITRSGSGSVIYQSFEDVDIVNGTPTQLLNVATRMRVETGENVLIGGFIINGVQDKNVIVRALGPSLTQSGLSDTLADPLIELYDSDGTLVASNDNWRDTQETDIQASGFAPPEDSESAILATLPPDGYTVIVKGSGDTAGTGLVDAYDLDPDAASQFGNISTRGFVQTQDNVMIGGFILGNNTGTTRVVLRGLGPSLAKSGVSNVLSDPTLDLYDSNGNRIVFNDDWMDNPAQAVQLSANGFAPPNSKEAGIFVTLLPGQYTAILAGADEGTGVGLIEAYNLP